MEGGFWFLSGKIYHVKFSKNTIYLKPLEALPIEINLRKTKMFTFGNISSSIPVKKVFFGVHN